MGIEKGKGGLISHKAKGALTECIKLVFLHGESLKVQFMGHGQRKDSYRLEAPPNSELSGGGLRGPAGPKERTSARTTRRRPSSA